MYISVLVFTHSEVGNWHKIIKLKVKIGTGYRQEYCQDFKHSAWTWQDTIYSVLCDLCCSCALQHYCHLLCNFSTTSVSCRFIVFCSCRGMRQDLYASASLSTTNPMPTGVQMNRGFWGSVTILCTVFILLLLPYSFVREIFFCK